MSNHRRGFYGRLLCGAAVVSLMAAGAARAEEQATTFNIAPQPLSSALNEFATQSKTAVLFTPELTGKTLSPGLTQVADAETALRRMLVGTDLTYRRNGDTFIIMRADDPQGGSAASGGAEVEALIVTAQKREEDIQDVPIAISAFTQEDLTRSQVAGGPDLITQVPNMTFTKTNFSSYSIQIRGIGTQAISATTDPAVAVAFNNTPFVRNRFFEQEFYDLQRVEVLRGPQGTLYGRNATAGVVNIISQKPRFALESKLSADVSNYNSTRLEGMVNVPLVEDKVALRIAGAWTKRQGFVTNEITGNQIDGRDLWSTRLSLRFVPTDYLEANLIWEHFEEDDDRLRSGKQVCHRDARTQLGEGSDVGVLTYTYGSYGAGGAGGLVNQGCLPSSMYAPEAFEAPNGFSLPFYHPLGAIFLPAVQDFDPYVSTTQSSDLRVIESTVDPHYTSEADVVELQISYDLWNGLSLTSETAYSSDELFSTQDYNRFNTAPGAFDQARWEANPPYIIREGVLEDGVFCDPQIGCADRLVAVDLSTATSRQLSQELRLSSDFDGDFNFSLGANFLRYDTIDKYYVFINTLTMIAAIAPYGGGTAPYVPGVSDNSDCMPNGLEYPDPNGALDVGGCVYIDPNPIGNLNDLGHNYFLSKNPYKLISYALFGEAYYNLTESLKVTAGLRWTVDKKEAPRIPSWVLGQDTVGYPVAEVVEQEWREPTGRLTVDWKPDLAMTDETLLFASYARGYKAGGANPPAAGTTIYCGGCGNGDAADLAVAASASAPRTFEPEFVNAFEVGAKNTLWDGRLTLNLGAFFYDYKGYQISYIVNRAAVNLNFDAKVMGAELEADWRPIDPLRFGLKLGYEDTEVADGERAIDVMDRTAGDQNWIVMRPFPTFPSNCIIPLYTVAGTGGQLTLPANSNSNGNPGMCETAYLRGLDPVTNLPYEADPDMYAEQPGWTPAPRDFGDYPGFNPASAPNNGEGFYKELGGNELPNAPHFTATITADYTVPLPSDWLMTLHTDLYYQSEAWTRIFNMEGYDKLKAYTNVNLAAIFTNEDAGWKVMAYVKNVFDRDSITGAFLNSDDTGLTTNVFLTEPRLYGLRVTKEWSGGPWWTGASPDHTGHYPLTIEIGGQVQDVDAPYETVRPSFADAFDPALDIAPSLQHRDFDTGDGRELRIAYRPSASWRVIAGVRYGRANTDTARGHAEVAAEPVCGFPEELAAFCQFFPIAIAYPIHWADVTASSREEHRITDFAVGREVGLGGLSRSEVALGLRYARLDSQTHMTSAGIPEWDVPAGWYGVYGAPSLPATAYEYRADLTASREFDGAGPAVSWEAARALAGTDGNGVVAVDWRITAGLLFGRQETEVSGSQTSEYFNVPFNARIGAEGVVMSTPPDIGRSKSVSVPVLDLSLGLSYEIQRVKVGLGYRWERYFDVLDVGYDEHRGGDRTIDGPYFKIAVGFGG